MSVNDSKNNQIEIEFNKLNISDGDFDINKNCLRCDKPFTEELWCKECDPFRIVEGWTSGNQTSGNQTSGNPDIDNFIKDTMYKPKNYDEKYNDFSYKFLEWVPFDRFTNIKEVGEGGFAKVYSATWIDGKSYYYKVDKSWEKNGSKHMKVALKRLNGSQNMSDKYLNELKIHWKISNSDGLELYGMTKDSETKEFMMIIQFADEGNLRSSLSNNFNTILWKDKINLLRSTSWNLRNLHELGYFHRDFHSGNILRDGVFSYISDFGLSGPANEQKCDNKVYGVMAYIAPEVLNGKEYTKSSDIYSLGVIMAELSSGKPPFYNKKHDLSLALAICNGLRPEFGIGTPDFYKKLAYKCMDANSTQRPTANELKDIFKFWDYSIYGDNDDEKFGYKGKEVRIAFEEADKEIPNILTSYEKNYDTVYTSRAFTYSKLLPKPVNSSIITSYVNDEENCDSQLVDFGSL